MAGKHESDQRNEEKKFKGVQLSVWPILGFQVKLHQLKHILIMQGETINVPKNQDNIVQH